LDEHNLDVETLSYENDPMIIKGKNDPKILGYQKRKSEKTFICVKCGKFFTRQFGLKQHVDGVHEGKRGHKCGMCNKAFTSKSNLNAHIKFVHEGKRDHKRGHEGKSNYKCHECEKTFTEKSDLIQHIKLVHKCGECNKAFYRRAHLNHHIKSAHPKRYYLVHPMIIDRKNDPKMNADQGKIEKFFCCDKCEMSFVSIDKLKSHIDDIHNVKREYKCEECKKSFSKKSVLNIRFKCIHQGNHD
jgi:KRAB domain-containing zinc finger protein